MLKYSRADISSRGNWPAFDAEEAGVDIAATTKWQIVRDGGPLHSANAAGFGQHTIIKGNHLCGILVPGSGKLQLKGQHALGRIRLVIFEQRPNALSSQARAYQQHQ